MRQASGLIKQPAVEHRVQRQVGCLHFHRAEQFIPMRQHILEGLVDG